MVETAFHDTIRHLLPVVARHFGIILPTSAHKQNNLTQLQLCAIQYALHEKKHE